MAWSAVSQGRSVPWRLQQACFRRDGWTCQECGYRGQRGRAELQADHVHARAEGGLDVLANLRTLCVSCHGVKSEGERRRGVERRSGRRRPRVHPADVLR